MNIEDWEKYGDYLKRGRVFCVDCSDQIVIELNPPDLYCMTCNKHGIPRPELDTAGKPLIATDEEGNERIYARIHPILITSH
jgi:hypothetical protein